MSINDELVAAAVCSWSWSQRNGHETGGTGVQGGPRRGLHLVQRRRRLGGAEWNRLRSTGIQPGGVDKLLQAYPALGIRIQTLADELFGILRERHLPYQLSLKDLLVGLIGYVSAEHVVEEDAK